MYQARILDKDRQLKAVLPGVRWHYNRRINEATEISIYIPRETIDEVITQDHPLYGFFGAAQPVVVEGAPKRERDNKPAYAAIASYVQIYQGDQLRASGKIVGRDLGQVVTVHAMTEEILLEANLTPAQYGKVWDGWDLADVARDLLDGWQTIRVKAPEQWQQYMVDSYRVDLTTDPGLVMLAKDAGGKYYESGYIVLAFSADEVPGFKCWDRIRWSADSDGSGGPGQEPIVRTTIQWSPNGSSWSAEWDGGLPEEVGYYIGGTYSRVYVRINLYTNDTESEDNEGNPVGVTPTVFACELIARTGGPGVVAGNIPATAGVKVKGLDANYTSALQVLVAACEQVDWEFAVWNGALSVAEALGTDRTRDFVFRGGSNIEIVALGDDDDELVNVLTAYGPGQGINRMEITLRDEASINEYGEYPAAVEFDVGTLAELEQKAQEFLSEHNSPKTQFEIAVAFEHGKEPEYGLGDKVRVADPDTGIVTTARIMAEAREYAESGLSVRLELGKASLNLQQVLEGKPQKPTDPMAPTGIWARGIVRGIRVGFSKPKGAWDSTEVHVSTAHGFTPSGGTLRDVGKQTQFDILELEPGTRYYAKVVHIDSDGRKSKPSKEVSAVPITMQEEQLKDYTDGVTDYVERISPVLLVSELPELPDPRYPVGTIVFLITEEKLYRNDGEDWVPLISMNLEDLEGKLQSNQIALEAIKEELIAAEAIASRHIQIEAVTAEKIAHEAVQTEHIDIEAVTAEKIAHKAVQTEHIDIEAVTAEKIAHEAVQTEHIDIEAVTAEKIAHKAVQTEHIDIEAVTAEKIAHEAVQTEHIDIEAVTAEKIAHKAVQTEHIDTGAITETKISDNAISAPKIKAGAIVADKIAANAVTAAKIAANAVTANKIAAGAVETEKLATNAVTAGKIAAEAIQTNHIHAGAVKADQIAANAVTAAKIAANAVTANKIAAGAVETEKLATNAVTAEKIAAEAIQTNHISAGAVKADQIAANAVTAEKIAANAVTANKIAAGAVETEKLATNAVTAEKIAAEAIQTNHISAGAVKADQIAANAVTAAKIAANAVTANKIAAGAVETEKLATNAVTAEKIAAEAIQTNHISAGAVKADQIAANAVTAAKIAANAVTANKIAAGAVETEKLATNAVTAGKIAAEAIQTNHISAGAVKADQIAANAVTAAKIAANAVTANKIAAGAVETEKLAANAVTAEKIAAGAIQTNHISAGAVTADQIAANAVTTTKILAGAVTASKLAVNAVTTNKISAGAVTAAKIAAEAIQTQHLAAGAVTADKLTVDETTTNKIIAGIAQIGGLSADYIKAGTISYDKLNVAYAIVQSAYASGVPAATLITPHDRDSWNLAVWPNINWMAPPSGDVWYWNWIVFNHQPLGTMGESFVVQFGDGMAWSYTYVGVYMDRGLSEPFSLTPIGIGSNKLFGVKLRLVTYNQVWFDVYTSHMVSDRPVNLHVRFRRNAIG